MILDWIVFVNIIYFLDIFEYPFLKIDLSRRIDLIYPKCKMYF